MILGIRQFALGVPDLRVGADFYSAFGLNVNEGEQDTLGFRCDNRPNDEVVLIETGKRKQFQYISFAADKEGMASIAANLIEKRIERLDPPAAYAPEGLWFRDPDNALLNIHLSEPAVIQPIDEPRINHPGIVNRINTRGCPRFDTQARPTRLGHLILFSTDVQRKAKFYCDVLGMKISDTIEGGYAAFLRSAAPLSDHHVMGILKSDGPGFHHASFEMPSADHSALAANSLLNSDTNGGARHAWGPGRHGVGSNYFQYFRDPWNSMAEYFYDMDAISADCDWETADWTKKDGMFLWSNDGKPPGDFGKNYEL